MRTRFAATAAIAFFVTSAAFAAGGGGGGGGGPVNPPGNPEEPDYYQDPSAGVSGDGSGSTGADVNAVPVAPVGSTSYATPNYGSNAGLGGAAQGGFVGESTPTGVYRLGQVFTAPGGTLNQISFVDTNSAAGGEQLHIVQFNSAAFQGNSVFTSSDPIGTNVYNSGVVNGLTNFGDGGGVNGNDALFYHTFSGIGLALTAGQDYYAYIDETSGSNVFDGSNSGYQSRAYFFELATLASALPGEFVEGTLNSDGTSNYARIANQKVGTAPYLQTYANISITPDAAPLPEPASWAMIVAGFGMAGAALRRRRVGAVLPA